MQQIQMTTNMIFDILGKYGSLLAKDRELLKIHADANKAWRNCDEDKMRAACERFAKWEKRHLEAGL